jgi:hypothetical protein
MANNEAKIHNTFAKALNQLENLRSVFRPSGQFAKAVTAVGGDTGYLQDIDAAFSELLSVMNDAEYGMSAHMSGANSQEESADLSEEPNEGNEFSGALSQAKKSGKSEFEVDGKKYKVQEGDLNEAKGYDIVNGLLTQFQSENGITGPARHLLSVANPSMKVWTRGDGTRYRDPGKIELWDRTPEAVAQQKEFWSWLMKQPGVKNVGKISGEFGSSSSTDAYIYNGLYFTLNQGGIKWGSASRFKNPRSVWKNTPNDQEKPVQESKDLSSLKVLAGL